MSKKIKKAKINKFVEQSSSGESEEVMNFLKMLISLVAILLVFYLVFAIFNGEIKFGNEKETVETKIQNIEIMAGSSFNRKESEYYVVYYDFDGDYSIKLDTIYTIYSQKPGHLKMYKVDLGNPLNNSYIVSEKEKVNTSSISSLKVVDPTIVKVKDGKAIKTVKGVEEIDAFLDTLLK